MNKFHDNENSTNKLSEKIDPPTLIDNNEVQSRVTRLRSNKNIEVHLESQQLTRWNYSTKHVLLMFFALEIYQYLWGHFKIKTNQ